MKLRHKKTGEIVNANELDMFADSLYLKMSRSGKLETKEYSSIKEFADEWEDYKEPFSTSFYTIVDGKIKHCIFYRERISGCPSNAWAYLKDSGRERINQLKEVGLYFKTEKEAEKAVEKLKALKRLKDKGFKFRWIDKESGNIKYAFYVDNPGEIDRFDYEDLDLLFGDKE